MKLLNSFVSPFAARVRLAIYAYDLPVDIAPSGMWLPDFQKSPAFLAINPIGRVPTLILDDGTALPESGVIVEYLADAFPGTGLRPGDAQAIARDRLLAHLAELYLQSPAGPLFGQVFAPEKDRATIDRCVAAMDNGLSHIDYFMGSGRDGADEQLSIADSVLAPFLYFFATRMVEALGADPIIERHAKLAAYWARLQQSATVGKVLGEMAEAIVDSPLRSLVAVDA